jgi:hypothetical protein
LRDTKGEKYFCLKKQMFKMRGFDRDGGGDIIKKDCNLNIDEN